MKIGKKLLYLFFWGILFSNIFVINLEAETNKNPYALSYHVGKYDMLPENDGSLSVTIDGTKYYYSDDFDSEGIGIKLAKMENQNVLYELHSNEITKVYTMDEILIPKVVSEPEVKDGLTYRNGKFDQKSFDLVVKVSVYLAKDFEQKNLFWFLSDEEKECLYINLKKLEIEPSGEVDFGSKGWWMWKEYMNKISEDINVPLKAEETREYKYTVNLHDDKVANQEKYNMSLYTTVVFETGMEFRKESKIPIGNLDYQEQRTEEKKKNSNSGKVVAEASNKLDGLQSALTFKKNYFSNEQMKQINEFVNIWTSELILAKYVDKSELKEKMTEKIANKLLKNLGIDTSVSVIPGTIYATTFLETQTEDGTKVFIKFCIELIDIDFGNSGMPTMATGTGEAIVYNMDGEELDSSVILPTYANVCAFCEQLQKVAENTIFSGAKEYLSIFGVSAESTAEALSSKMMEQILNNKYAKNVFKRVDAKNVKAVLKKALIEGEKYCNKKIFKLITTPSKDGTQISIKCPVDVKVYDSDGNLCGVVENNIVDPVYNDIFITVVGEQKNIYLIGDDYSFELTGTDTGSMDYIVREIDEKGAETRKITYENVKLSNGCKYYSYVPNAVNHDSVLFDLTDSEGNIISPTTGVDEEVIDDFDGKCGEDVYWKLSDNGVLRVFGSGKMYDYSIIYGRLTPWYVNKEEIKNVLVEEGVLNIGNDAFYECSNLNNINISESVMSIGNTAFWKCSNLDSINLSKNITTIGDFAFSRCNLRNVNLPDNITKIGGGIFCECSNLERVDLSDNITNIDSYTFDECSSLKYIDLPEKLTYIGSRAFRNCINLESISLPDGVITIEFEAFEGCKNMHSVSLPSNLKNIGNGGFLGCISLKNLHLPVGLLSIGGNTFAGCSSLESITLPQGLETIEACTFSGCSSLKNVILPDDLIEIGYMAFKECGSLKSIILPDNIVSIGDAVFEECSNLEYIQLPINLVEIGNEAFFRCCNLKSVILPNSLISIGRRAFVGCSSLEHIILPESIANIGEVTFSGCGNITILNRNCVIYDERNTIGTGIIIHGYSGSTAEAYARKYDREFVALDGNIANGSGGTGTGSNTNNVPINPADPSINNNTISTPSTGTKLTDPITHSIYTVTASGTTVAYTGTTNKNATTITIPATVKINNITYKVTSVSASAFKNNKKLKKITIPNSIITVGASAFQSCTSLTTIKMGNSVTTIGNKAFYNCKKLTSVSITKNTTTIGNSAFENCVSLKKITVPAKVKKIGNKAFYSCKKLNNLTIQSKKLTAKNVGNKAFTRIGSSAYKKLKVKVPSSKYTTYKKLLQKKGLSAKAKITKK